MGGTGACPLMVELGLVPLGRAMSRGVFKGGCGFRMTLGRLSADGWGCVPVLLVVWPEMSQHWSLQAVRWGQFLLPSPLGELTLMNIPWGLCLQCPCPHSEPQLTPTSLGDPPRPAGRSGSGSYVVTALPWVPVHVKPYVHLSRVESLFLSVLCSSCTQAPKAFKAKCSGGYSFQCQTPRLGSLMGSSELSLLWENLCDIIIFQFVSHPLSGYGV